MGPEFDIQSTMNSNFDNANNILFVCECPAVLIMAGQYFNLKSVVFRVNICRGFAVIDFVPKYNCFWCLRDCLQQQLFVDDMLCVVVINGGDDVVLLTNLCLLKTST